MVSDPHHLISVNDHLELFQNPDLFEEVGVLVVTIHLLLVFAWLVARAFLIR
jgi:flagellar biogenesis protein FliO